MWGEAIPVPRRQAGENVGGRRRESPSIDIDLNAVAVSPATSAPVTCGNRQDPTLCGSGAARPRYHRRAPPRYSEQIYTLVSRYSERITLSLSLLLEGSSTVEEERKPLEPARLHAVILLPGTAASIRPALSVRRLLLARC